MSQSETKKKLIDAAIKVFSEKGYFNARVSDIVKEAGVAQGTFYIYFKSKEDAFLFIVNMITSEVYKIIEETKKLEIPAEEKINVFAEKSYSLIGKYREIAKILFFQLMCVDEKFKNIHVETNKKIKDFYLNALSDLPEKELVSDIILGFGKRLFEFELLMENKPVNEVIKKFKDGIKIIFKGLKK
jgi:AcrR family transcriptional regulator